MSGIYIHIPFCKQACHYCDFHFSTSLKKRDEMIEAIKRELVLRKDEFHDVKVDTIYFGGGTPSILDHDEVNSILETVHVNYQVSDTPEITLEANPDDLSKSVIEKWSNSSVNRLSIGIQSFRDEDLKLMNRAHNSAEALQSLRIATHHFDNISVDLIYGIPGLSHDAWKQNIETALSFGIPHISSYALTVEPKTALASFIKKGIVDDVDDDQAEAQFHMLIDILDTNGFIHYELSNFGKEEYFSRNNSAYWQGKPYIGIGPSAHSFNGAQRGWNVRNNSKYIKAIQKNELPIEVETLTSTDRYNEYIMTGLRTIWGVSLTKIRTEFGESFKKYLIQQAQPFINEHLLYIDDEKLLVTKKGKFLSDGIASNLFKINL